MYFKSTSAFIVIFIAFHGNIAIFLWYFSCYILLFFSIFWVFPKSLKFSLFCSILLTKWLIFKLKLIPENQPKFTVWCSHLTVNSQWNYLIFTPKCNFGVKTGENDVKSTTCCGFWAGDGLMAPQHMLWCRWSPSCDRWTMPILRCISWCIGVKILKSTKKES